MKISLVTDEVSSDPETAIELALTWGIRDFELRGIGPNRVPLLSDHQKDRLKNALDAFEVKVVAISPGLFKCPYPSGDRERFPMEALDSEVFARWRSAQDLARYHLEELLPRSLQFAREVGAAILVVFGFHRGGRPAGQAPDEVLEALRMAAERAEVDGVSLALEVEDGFWGDTGQRTAALLAQVNHRALGVNWDPANATVAGETAFPAGYQAVREFVRHVHFKDVRLDAAGGHRYAVEGEIDWSGQIGALARDGYRGFLSIEPHMAPRVKAAEAMAARLQQLIRTAAYAC